MQLSQLWVNRSPRFSIEPQNFQTLGSAKAQVMRSSRICGIEACFLAGFFVVLQPWVFQKVKIPELFNSNYKEQLSFLVSSLIVNN
jgi:hypothetical protein